MMYTTTLHLQHTHTHMHKHAHTHTAAAAQHTAKNNLTRTRDEGSIVLSVALLGMIVARREIWQRVHKVASSHSSTLLTQSTLLVTQSHG